MFGILLTVCLLSGNHECKDVTLATQSEPIPAYSCMLQAMPDAAKWIAENPGWYIKGWSCGVLKDLKVSI